HTLSLHDALPILVSYNWQRKGEMADLSDAEKWDLKRYQGLPILGTEIKVVDESNEPLPHDGKSMGEVLIRGPWIARSYPKLDDNDERFHDGWWRYGDVGVITPEGY